MHALNKRSVFTNAYPSNKNLTTNVSLNEMSRDYPGARIESAMDTINAANLDMIEIGNPKIKSSALNQNSL